MAEWRNEAKLRDGGFMVDHCFQQTCARQPGDARSSGLTWGPDPAPTGAPGPNSPAED